FQKDTLRLLKRYVTSFKKIRNVFFLRGALLENKTGQPYQKFDSIFKHALCVARYTNGAD
ncbi:MAG: hypothetical protein RR365_11440, partial [Bacteroides sp.]